MIDRTYNYTRGSGDPSRDSRNNASLLTAAIDGQYGRVKQLLEFGAEIDHRDRGEITALHYAIWAGHEDIFELLLESGADVNAASITAGTPLCLAVLKERNRMIGVLMKKYRASINLAHPTTGTPLHCATFIGNEAIAVTLLDLGARPDALSRVHISDLRRLSKSPVGDLFFGLQISCDHDVEMSAPLMMAVFENRPRLAAILVDAGASIDQPCEVRKTAIACNRLTGREFRLAYPLGIAAFCGFANMLQWLILRGADVHSHGIFGIPPMLLASMCGNFDTVRRFYPIYIVGVPVTKHCRQRLIRCDCTLYSKSECKPQADERFASSESRDACIATLCSYGADVNHFHVGLTPLLVATRSKRLQCVEILLHNNADPNFVRQWPWDPMTALQWGAYIGSTSMMSLLLDAGADLRTVDEGDRTPLVLAIEGRHSGVVDMILKHVEPTNAEALDILRGRHLDRLLGRVLNLLDQGPCVRKECLKIAARLVRFGAEVDTVDESGNTALHHATSVGDYLLVSEFLDAGADIDIKDREGRTALHLAVNNRNELLVPKLVDAGANVDDSNWEGNTALHAAAGIGNDLLVSKLLDAGASVNLTGLNGVTALHIAAWKGHKAVVSRLLVAGADTAVTCTWDEVKMRAKDWAKLYKHTEVYDLLLQYERESGQDTGIWALFHNTVYWSTRGLFG
jgi:ankyrin repeat protein